MKAYFPGLILHCVLGCYLVLILCWYSDNGTISWHDKERLCWRLNTIKHLLFTSFSLSLLINAPLVTADDCIVNINIIENKSCQSRTVEKLKIMIKYSKESIPYHSYLKFRKLKKNKKNFEKFYRWPKFFEFFFIFETSSDYVHIFRFDIGIYLPLLSFYICIIILVILEIKQDCSNVNQHYRYFVYFPFDV